MQTELDSSKFSADFHLLLDHVMYLSANPECTKEAGIHLLRYKQLVATTISKLKSTFDQNHAAIQQEQKIISDQTETDQKWKAFVADNRYIVKLIKETSHMIEGYGQTFHDCLSRYLASRFELVVKRFRPFPGATPPPSSLEQASEKFKSALDMLQQDVFLFDELFQTTPDVQRHLDYYLQQALIPLGEGLNFVNDGLSLEERNCLKEHLASLVLDAAIQVKLCQIALKSLEQ